MDNQHGGNVVAFAKAIECNVSEVIDLSSNINFLKPKIEIDFNKLNISSYPNYEKLELAIAKLYNIKSSQLELFNGATTAIYSLFRMLNLQHCTLYAPLYLEYEKAARLYNYQIEQIDRFKDLNKEVKENSLVIFVNPSTPDGKFYELDRLMKKWQERECTILIDESFLEFTPFSSVTKELKSYKRLYILKSMTKFYSAAGIRIGAILSNEKNIENIKKQEPLWKISEFDSHYLQSALANKSFKKEAQELNAKHREKLVKLLGSSKYIEHIYPSSANFVMIKLKDIDAKEFQKRLTPFKIMVRDCSNFKYLDSSYIRVAIKDKESLEALQKALVVL